MPELKRVGARGGAWKAVVVGSYERADRALTVGRLVELCGYYHADPVEVLRAALAVDGQQPTDPRVRLLMALQQLRSAGAVAADLVDVLGEGPADEVETAGGDVS